LYIKAAKSYFDEPREKLSPRSLAAEATISRSSKDFVAKVYTTFCVQPKICNYKMNKLKFTMFQFRVHNHPELKNIINCAVANLIPGNLNGSMKNVTVTLRLV
jgi:hypothetical protein